MCVQAKKHRAKKNKAVLLYFDKTQMKILKNISNFVRYCFLDRWVPILVGIFF